jgi:predicted acyltransferase
MQLPLRAQFAAGAAILVAHTALFQLFPGSDGPWSRADNVGVRIDHFFGLEYSGFYVTINFLSSSVTTLLGVWCGYLMIAPNSHKRRLQVLAAAVAGCWLSGLLLSLVIPDVKRIWTASFTLLSGGWVILLLLAFYWMVEVKGWRRATFPLVVVGMNSLFIYSTKMVLGGWLRDKIGIFAGDFQFLGDWAPVASYTAAFAALWYLCYWLYQRKIFIKI